MPLQYLPLQQRQKQITQPRSAVSEALTPQPKGISGEGVAARWEREEAAAAERKFQEKMMKLQHEQGMEKLRFTTGMKEDAAKGITAGQALERAPAAGAAPTAAPLTKENMPEAAKEMYELLKTLPDEMQNVLLQQIFTQTEPAGTITSAGKTVTMPEKYNAIADVFLSKGWATISAEGKPVLSEPERLFERGTFVELENGDILNTATNEVIARAGDDPEVKVNAMVKQIRDDALAVIKTDPSISLEDATHDAGIDYGLSEEEAVEIAKFTEMPEGAKKKNAFKEWFKNWDKRVRQYGREMQEKYKPKAKPAFNEDIARTLTNVISDDVTDAERAHFKTQGASDADIDEAIKRKGSK